MARERLQKILSRAGIASRRKAEALIEAGRVTVNGKVATLGDSADGAADAVKVDGRRVKLPTAYRYLLLQKPRGVLSTRSDPKGRPTVFDLLPPAERKGLRTVGRLDFQTEGLLLLTDDGDFAQLVAHPRHGCSKTYEVKVKGHPTEKDIDRLRRGIVLQGRRTAPARIDFLRHSEGAEKANSWWRVELTEGRTRQIREIFQRVGHPVSKLRRVAIGTLRDPKLPRGGVRPLTEREIRSLRRTGAGSKRQGSRGRR
jgi:pseudouridine synthase